MRYSALNCCIDILKSCYTAKLLLLLLLLVAFTAICRNIKNLDLSLTFTHLSAISCFKKSTCFANVAVRLLQKKRRF